MPKYFQHNQTGIGQPPDPKEEPLLGGQLAIRSPITAAARAQDKIPALGRRVLWSYQIRGSLAFSADTGTGTWPTQFLPSPTLARPIGFAAADVTPGSKLILNVRYTPSGQTQVPDGLGEFVAGGPGGSVKVVIVWTAQDSSTVTTTHTAALIASQEDLNAPPENFWGTVKSTVIDPITPPINTQALRAKWTAHVHAAITVYAIGGARLVDAVLYEKPLGVAREADDDADLWTSHLYGSPQPYGSRSYPVTEWDSTDTPQGGTHGLMRTANAQGLRLGPHLFSWTAHDDDIAGGELTSNVQARAFSSTSLVRLDGVSTGWSATEPGWSLYSHAWDAGECDPYWGGQSMPVCLAVYARGEAPGLVRIQTDPYSWVECATAIDTNFGWYFAYGHLPVNGLAQAFARRTGGSGAFNIASISLYRMGQYTPLG